MPFSQHSHSGEFCAHAKGTLEEVVLTAIELGFRIYGLSEHCPRYREEDLYPEEQEANLTPRLLHTRFTSFLEEAHRLKEIYADQITLLVGLETEYITPTDLEGLGALIETHGDQIEYMVGGVHHVRGMPIDFDRETWEECVRSFDSDEYDDGFTGRERSLAGGTYSDSALSAFLCAYFDAQYTLISIVRPSIIAHMDLCRLYAPSLRFADFPEVWERVERNVRVASDYGALFEANAAAFRKGWEDAYPGSDVLQLILRLGGRLTLSDDSHGPHAVGLNYPRLRTYLLDQGVTELWHLSYKPSIQGIEQGEMPEECKFWERFGWEPSVYATRVYGEWWRLGFWDGDLPET
ncbi:Polymerase/histidinol phosphatase-like protein [Pterulicium gracile]|uniref:Histidinol-phosphatase n=1 Tax=Pterulicium gracile TaxID=1884261 RepID=A0A5C3QSS3_9AGAR|nr:Polymerase/histidinol phosphatase-like protein [Pterula gracilis]